MFVISGGSFGGGDGTSGNPYLVEDAADLNAVRNSLAAHYKQTADISLSGYPNFEPIGNYISVNNPFTGGYDFNWHRITDLTISNQVGWIGLFGSVDGAVMENGVVDGASIQKVASETAAAAVLIGQCANATIEKMSISGSVTNNFTDVYDAAAIMVGYAYNNVFRDCRVTGTSSSGSVAAGFAGIMVPGNIFENCFAAVSVQGNAPSKGGFAGLEHAGPNTFTAVYYDSDVSGQSDTGKGTPKTTAEMKQQATFQGWNFCTVWEINEGISYPIHRINSPFSPPAIKTTVIRSARPTVILNFPRLSACSGGPGLHFRIEVFADVAMTVLISDLNSQAHEFEYRPHDGASWTSVLSSGLPATQYANRDTQIRAQMTVGPRQRVYLRASVGEAA